MRRACFKRNGLAARSVTTEILSSAAEIPRLLATTTMFLRRQDEVHMSDRGKLRFRRPPSTEWLLVEEQSALLGSQVVSPRRGYLHHGIYVGDGKVVHYSGLANGLLSGSVEETSFAGFGRGRPIWIKSHAPSRFRVGEDSYRLFTNNCEHFCEWCLRGEPRSYQVEAWLARPGRALRAAVLSIVQPFSAPAEFDRSKASSAATET
jgi:Lecithin retinol acyltransferase